MDLKQLRIRIIEGINSEGEFEYSEGFDLTNLSDVDFFKHIEHKIKYLYGFILEGSNFKKDDYVQQTGSNEFNPILEVIQADDLGKDFKVGDDLYRKMPYQIIYDSILEVRNDLHDLLIYAQDGIDGVLEYKKEKIENSEICKKYQKLI